MALVEQYCKTMGKVVIICKDRPGFVVNRFFVPWINEACRLLQEEVASASQIDKVACECFRIGLGPFALMNLTGPAIALHSSDYLSEQLKVPRFRGADNLRNLAEEGGLWDIEGDDDCDKDREEIIRKRLMGQSFAICSQIVDEGICSMEDVDRGAKVGLRWEFGPFELANRIGVSEASSMAKEYSELAGIEIPDWFKIADSPFNFSYIDVSIEDGIATVLINRPEAMNALNVNVVEQLGRAIRELNSRKDVNTIVLEGAGKAFVAGADVKFFVDKIRSDSFSEIYDFTSNGHKVINSIENSPKTTIALVTGLALGGGLELALACDYRIGTERSQLRFPETSISIYPGLGGTQRTPRICGIEAARFSVLAGNILDSDSSKALGLITHLVHASECSNTIQKISSLGKPEEKYPGAPFDPDHPTCIFSREFYSDSNMEFILSGLTPDGFDPEDPIVAKQIRALSRSSPIAVATANDLLDQALETGEDLHAGLQLELDGLEDMFSINDALEGLSALIEGRRPEFSGS
tara:strand:+ start:112 stop:1683 length:1572 start_codon:yes stop_codon:yes gene_type:complete